MPKAESVLFVANVQGPRLVKARNIRRNYSIAGNTKVFGICRAFADRGQDIGVYSPGSPAERSGRYYSAMTEEINTGKRLIPVWYGATVDNRFLRTGVEIISLLQTLPRLIRKQRAGVVVVYNLSAITLLAGIIAKIFGCKLILEYEDSALAARTRKPPLWRNIYRVQELLMRRWCFGVYAPSMELLDAIACPNRLLLPGVLDTDLIQAIETASRTKICTEQTNSPPLIMLYSGGMDESKGIDTFLEAVEQVDTPLEIHICGRGPLAEKLKYDCSNSRHSAVFHGLVDRDSLIELQTHCDIGINPHRTDLHAGGMWPFKVVEYLAGCGTVLCSRSGSIPDDLASRLFLYDGNSAAEMATALKDLIARWTELAQGAEARRLWAIEQFGPACIAQKIDALIRNDVPTKWQGC